MRTEEEIRKAMWIAEREYTREMTEFLENKDCEQETQLHIKLSHSESFIAALQWVLGGGQSLQEMSESTKK